jgi:hypothetical protein
MDEHKAAIKMFTCEADQLDSRLCGNIIHFGEENLRKISYPIYTPNFDQYFGFVNQLLIFFPMWRHGIGREEYHGGDFKFHL